MRHVCKNIDLTNEPVLLTMECMLENNGLKSRRPKKLVLIIIGAVLVLILAAAAGYFFWQYTNLKNNPNAAAQETTQRLVEKVGQLYALPGDEQPTVAQVQDKEKLKEQAFFSKAENGDYILIYTNAKLALLYREKENRLMNVGPITISDQSSPSTAPTDTDATNNP